MLKQVKEKKAKRSRIADSGGSSIKLSERAMLVSLHVKSPSFIKLDKRITEETNSKYKASTDAGRYSKRLVSRDALRELTKIVGLARKTHRTFTLPWEDDGARIITTRAYQDYTKNMDQLGLQFNSAVKKLLKGWPEHIDAAKIRLGSMFNAEDYPPVHEIRNKFSLEVEPKPVPDAGDFRAKVSNEHVNAITADIERRTNERIERAMDDVWERIKDVTTKMSERLKRYESVADQTDKRTGTFRDSLIDNVRDVADLIPAINLNDDPRLEDIRKQLIELCSHKPEELKKDAKLRKRTRQSANDILKKVNDYLC